MAAGYRALHDFHMAEDVFQITMLKLLNTERNMEDMRSARTRSFIYAVARNTAIDMYRKKSRRAEFLTSGGDVYKEYKAEKENRFFCTSFDEYVFKYGFGEDFSDILEELDKTERKMIILKYFYMFSNKEISEINGMTPEAVRRKIKAILSEIKLLYLRN